METIEFKFVDKSEWPEGEWNNEPDKVQWPDEETGLPCLAVRNNKSGHWCGYVGVSSDHPLYGKSYNDADVTVHGGLTFSDFCQEEEHGICHVPGEGEPDNVYWFGFDCAHCYDLSPGLMRYGIDRTYVYRTLEYVKSECKDLARQLHEARK